MCASIYDTLLPLVVKRLGALVQGTGRFGFTFVISCWRLGHGLSLLLGESISQASSYEIAFFTLGGLGLLVTALLALCVHVPPAKAVEDQREITQEVAAEAQSETAVGDEVLSFGQLEADPHA